MPEPHHAYALPKWAPIVWLADAGPNVPDDIRARLISGFFTAIVSTVIGGLTNMSVNLVAVILHPTAAFIALLSLEAVLFTARNCMLIVGARAVKRGCATPTDLYLASSVAWAALVGCGTALCVASGDPVLQFLAPTTMMGIVAGITTRNNGAPRLAITQVFLCDIAIQFVLPFSGHPWMLLSVLQCPLFVTAMISTVFRLHRGYLAVVMAERESEERATHDALTGLWNRSGLTEALSRHLQRPPADIGGLALLYIDLDGFKAVNDGRGHAAGDDLLKQTAARIVAAAPQRTLVARLGGDEFVILAPGCDSVQALAIGETIIAAVSQPFDLGFGAMASIGASIGIACAMPSTTTDALLAEADGALYQAKANGKGRCVLAATRGIDPAASKRMAA